jgi:hypothetical protein
MPFFFFNAVCAVLDCVIGTGMFICPRLYFLKPLWLILVKCGMMIWIFIRYVTGIFKSFLMQCSSHRNFYLCLKIWILCMKVKRVKCTLVQALRFCTGCTVKCTLVQALRLCTGRTVKCTLVQALRLCTGCTADGGSRGIALPLLDHGNRRGWGVSVTPRPLFTPRKDPVPIVQEAGGPQGRSGQVWKISPTHWDSIPRKSSP